MVTSHLGMPLLHRGTFFCDGHSPFSFSLIIYLKVSSFAHLRLLFPLAQQLIIVVLDLVT
jgi:hypothetical protein